MASRTSMEYESSLASHEQTGTEKHGMLPCFRVSQGLRHFTKVKSTCLNKCSQPWPVATAVPEKVTPQATIASPSHEIAKRCGGGKNRLITCWLPLGKVQSTNTYPSPEMGVHQLRWFPLNQPWPKRGGSPKGMVPCRFLPKRHAQIRNQIYNMHNKNPNTQCSTRRHYIYIYINV